MLDKSAQLIEALHSRGFYEQSGWRIIKRSSSDHQANRSLFECIGVEDIISSNFN
jgi:hypothetical protein